MSDKQTNCTALAVIQNKGILRRLIDDIETPVKSAVESTGQLTANVIVASAQTVDLGMTSLNVLVEGVSSTAKYSSDMLKELDVDEAIKSVTVDLMRRDKSSD